ncbi:MAG: Lrp/AsnC family transcriptional regulator [Candidatus Omnitrophica bacterium]|nr:Lrp/AsnC family transcriptional regulator [Candidatus Omnitrophota bacterium]
MDDLDRKLLTEIQRDFPRLTEPFPALGEPVGISGDETLRRIKKLKEDQVLRQISAIFDTKSLGYKSTLVAMKFANEQLDQGAEIINRHPGVSHNYRRNDDFNLWFTVAVPPYHSLEETIQKLHELSGALRTLILPTLKLFKIGVKLDLTGSHSEALDSKEDIYDESRRRKAPPDLTEEHIEAIRALQEDIPLVERPFEEVAKNSGFTEARLFELLDLFETKGYFRRFAGILHHRKAGFSANAMVVWNIPEEKQDEVGEKMARFPQVSHCYKRPVFPDWPYSLYTMIHGPKVEDCEKVVQKIIQAAGDWPRRNLYSTKEYKKIRLKYFTKELDEWWETVGAYCNTPLHNENKPVPAVPGTGEATHA